jgi:hypothetical protein
MPATHSDILQHIDARFRPLFEDGGMFANVILGPAYVQGNPATFYNSIIAANLSKQWADWFNAQIEQYLQDKSSTQLLAHWQHPITDLQAGNNSRGGFILVHSAIPGLQWTLDTADTSKIKPPSDPNAAARLNQLMLSEIDRLAPLYAIANLALRDNLIRYAAQNATFQPTSDDVKKLNANLANLPTDFDLQTFNDTILAPSFPGGPPINNNQAGNFTYQNIFNEHERTASLYKITEPAVRDALIQYASTNSNFFPSNEEVKKVNNYLAESNTFNNNDDVVFDAMISSCFTDPTNAPSNYFSGNAGQAAFQKIKDEHNHILPLYAIKEPALRRALIDFATTPPGNQPTTLFVPTEDYVKDLNDNLAKLPGNAKVVDFNTIIPSHPNGPAGRNFFSNLESLDSVTFSKVLEEHERIAPLYAIQESVLRDALVEYAAANKDFEPQPHHITALNEKMANIGKLKKSAISQVVQEVFQTIQQGPNNQYFDVDPGVKHRQGIKDEHNRIWSLYQIKDETLRRHFIDIARTSNVNFVTPSSDQVKQFDDWLALQSKLDPGVLTTQANNFLYLGTAVIPNGYFVEADPAVVGAQAGPGANDFINTIQPRHDRLYPLYRIQQPELREALVNYALRNPNFEPSVGHITDLNNKIANIAESASEFNDTTLGITIGDAFNGLRNAPPQDYFSPSGAHAGASDFPKIKTEYERIKELYNVNLPSLRYALMKYAKENPSLNAPTRDQVDSLNKKIHENYPIDAADLTTHLDKAFSLDQGVLPSCSYFEDDPGNADFAVFEKEHLAYLSKNPSGNVAKELANNIKSFNDLWESKIWGPDERIGSETDTNLAIAGLRQSVLLQPNHLLYSHLNHFYDERTGLQKILAAPLSDDDKKHLAALHEATKKLQKEAEYLTQNNSTSNDQGLMVYVSLANRYHDLAIKYAHSVSGTDRKRSDDLLVKCNNLVDRLNAAEGFLLTNSTIPLKNDEQLILDKIRLARKKLSATAEYLTLSQSKPVASVNTYSEGEQERCNNITMQDASTKLLNLVNAPGGGGVFGITTVSTSRSQAKILTNTEFRIDKPQEFAYSENGASATTKVASGVGTLATGQYALLVAFDPQKINLLPNEEVAVIAAGLVEKFMAQWKDPNKYTTSPMKITANMPPRLAEAIITYHKLNYSQARTPIYEGKRLRLDELEKYSDKDKPLLGFKYTNYQDYQEEMKKIYADPAVRAKIDSNSPKAFSLTPEEDKIEKNLQSNSTLKKEEEKLEESIEKNHSMRSP